MTDINKPTGGDNEKQMNIQKSTEGKRNEISATLFGDEKAILNDLKEYHVKVEENVEMMGYKGKKMHINLPAVGKFKGFKFNCFISDEGVTKHDFEANKKLIKQSYSMIGVGKLLNAMIKYMEAFGIKIDEDKGVGSCLAHIGLSGNYWLKEWRITKVAEKDNGRTGWWSSHIGSKFMETDYDYNKENLLLKIYD